MGVTRCGALARLEEVHLLTSRHLNPTSLQCCASTGAPLARLEGGDIGPFKTPQPSLCNVARRQVRKCFVFCPAWKCVQRGEGPSRPGTPTLPAPRRSTVVGPVPGSDVVLGRAGQVHFVHYARLEMRLV